MRGVLGACLSALVGAVAAVSWSADAAVPGSCTNRSNYHAGGYTAATTAVFGSRARIEFNNPDLCEADATSHSASVVWSMITAGSATSSSPSADGWAQAGYGQFGSQSGFGTSGFHVFSQYTLKCKSTLTCGSGSSVKTEFGGTVTVSHFYENYVRASDGRIHMGVDGTQLDVTNYNPSGDWAPEYEGQFAGEVLHPQSDIAGTSSDVTTLDYLQKYSSSGSIAFFQVVHPAPVPYTRFHRSVTDASVGGQRLDIWTSPLGSF